MPDHTQRFTDRVEYYVRSRPGYPAAMLRFFETELGLSPLDPVADIGSGTGLLTELFVHNGNPTFAVEPNDLMRAAGEERLGNWSNFHSINGTAESTTLDDQSVKWVVAGQAFHWFDAEQSRAEFRRILKPGGMVGLIWNDRPAESSRFNEDYERFVNAHQVEEKTGERGSSGALEPSQIATFFGSTGYESRTFENPQVLDRQGLVDRVASASYMPLPAHPHHAAMLDELDELFKAHQTNGIVRIPLVTRAYVGRMTT